MLRHPCNPDCREMRCQADDSQADNSHRNSSSSNDNEPSSSSQSRYLQPGAYTYQAIAANLQHMDHNQLQTALATAIAAEDYSLASRIRDRLQQAVAGDSGEDGHQSADWRSLNIPDWLADRAERLALRFPTGRNAAVPPSITMFTMTL